MSYLLAIDFETPYADACVTATYPLDEAVDHVGVPTKIAFHDSAVLHRFLDLWEERFPVENIWGIYREHAGTFTQVGPAHPTRAAVEAGLTGVSK